MYTLCVPYPHSNYPLGIPNSDPNKTSSNLDISVDHIILHFGYISGKQALICTIESLARVLDKSSQENQ